MEPGRPRCRRARPVSPAATEEFAFEVKRLELPSMRYRSEPEPDAVTADGADADGADAPDPAVEDALEAEIVDDETPEPQPADGESEAEALDVVEVEVAAGGERSRRFRRFPGRRSEKSFRAGARRGRGRRPAGRSGDPQRLGLGRPVTRPDRLENQE